MAGGNFSGSHPTGGTKDIANAGQVLDAQTAADLFATVNGLVGQSSSGSGPGSGHNISVYGLTVDGVGGVTKSQAAGTATIASGLTVTAGGITATSGGITITAGGLTVSAGGGTFTGALTFTAGSGITLPTGSYLLSTGSGVGNTPGTGAGTAPTVSVLGSDSGGIISITPGTTPATSATIVTVSFSGTIATAGKVAGPIVHITPANAAASALNGTTQVVAVLTTGGGNYTGFNLVSGSAALTNGTLYKWFWSMPFVV